MSLDRTPLLEVLRQQRVAVVSSIGPTGAPQSAVVGIAVSDRLELVFDTLESTRKAANLRRDARMSAVIGGCAPGEEITVQYEGVIDRPEGAELETVKALYYSVYPDGVDRLSWPGLIYLRARPTWIRYSAFTQDPPLIVEWNEDELRRL